MHPRATRPAALAGQMRLVQRCDACEVMWRALPEEPCWSCGGPGVPASEAIIVAGT